MEEFKVCLRTPTNSFLILHRSALPGAQIIRTYNTLKNPNLLKIFWKAELREPGLSFELAELSDIAKLNSFKCPTKMMLKY